MQKNVRIKNILVPLDGIKNSVREKGVSKFVFGSVSNYVLNKTKAPSWLFN